MHRNLIGIVGAVAALTGCGSATSHSGDPGEAARRATGSGLVEGADVLDAHRIVFTRDAGRSFRVLAGPSGVAVQQALVPRPGVIYVRADGALYHALPAGRWARRSTPAGTIVGATAAGGHAWAVTREADRLTVWRSADEGLTWTPAALPTRSVSPADVPISFFDTRTGVIVVGRTLLVTTDGGTTWVARATPCARAPGVVAAAGPDGAVWLACGGLPGAGSQAVALHRSSDAGRDFGPAVTPGLPGVDYLASLRVIDRDTAIAGSDRGEPAITRDGGRHWRSSGLLRVAESMQPPGVVGRRTAWQVLASDHRVYRTADRGRTWRRASVG